MRYSTLDDIDVTHCCNFPVIFCLHSQGSVAESVKDLVEANRHSTKAVRSRAVWLPSGFYLIFLAKFQIHSISDLQ